MDEVDCVEPLRADSATSRGHSWAVNCPEPSEVLVMK